MNSVGIQVVIKLKRNMKQRLISLGDRLLLRKRTVVETVIDQLKNISQIEHPRHRYPVNCFVNILCGLMAISNQLKKPGIAVQRNLICSA
jgi:Transposase DDE domain